MPFTFGSLFSGIGGIDLGFERAGMVCKWQVEINEYCRRVLEKHWPTVRRWGDVATFPPVADAAGILRERTGKECDGSLFQAWRVDLIAGGFPCQPVSVAGRRQAERDPRWLWPHFARIVRQLRPRYVFVENVPGLLLPGSGGPGIFADLAQMGFDAEWATLPASAFGAPHLRERVFIVAYSQKEPCLRKRRRNTTRQQGAKAKIGFKKPPAVAVSDGNSPQARIFRAGREVAALPFPCWGTDQPGVARTSYGVPHRVDRIEGLGNAVVPQVAEWIGRLILSQEDGA